MRRLLPIVLAAALVAALAAPVGAHTESLRPYVVVLHEQADILRPDGRRADGDVVRVLRATASRAQAGLLLALDRARTWGSVARVEPLWVIDAVAITATPSFAAGLTQRADVAKVLPDGPVAIEPASEPQPAVGHVGAPTLWSREVTGEGVVVASLDTGVSLDHAELASRWRGAPGDWFDPYEQHAAPTDRDGHGTWTMGAAVAGDTSGTGIGVAPGASWIAARAFDDDGDASLSAIHRAFEWALDPDGDAGTDDAPDIVMAPWTFTSPGCDETFRPDVQALRAAGILPIFPAGNDGPDAGTSRSPANYPESFAVGAADLDDEILSLSARGPSSCAGDAVYPDIVAPGASIETTDLWGGYAVQSGTSMSTGIVAGTLALLLDAHPHLPEDAQASALEGGAVDLGASGVDDTFGHGRADVVGADAWATRAEGFRLVPTPDAVTVRRGASVQIQVEVRGGRVIHRKVSLRVDGSPPREVTIGFDPARVRPGRTSVVTVTAGPAAPTGPQTIRLIGRRLGLVAIADVLVRIRPRLSASRAG